MPNARGEMTDDEVFGLPAPQREMTDDEVFGAAPQPAMGGTQRALTIGAQGVGRGLAELVAMPGDIANSVINAGLTTVEALGNYVPGVPEFTLPRLMPASEGIAQLAGKGAEAAGVPLVDYTDMNTKERVAYNVNRMATQGVGGGAALAKSGIAAAAPYAEAMAGSAEATGPVSAAYRASRPYLADAAAGAGAGTAATATEDSKSPLARFMATLLGGAAGGGLFSLATSPRQAWEWGKYAIGDDPHVYSGRNVGPPNEEPGAPVTPSRLVADEARKLLRREGVDAETATSELRAGAAAARDAELPLPTSGLLSNDEGLIALERRLRRGRAGAAFTKQDREVAQSAADRLQSINPGDAVDSRDATGFVQREVAERRAGAQGVVDRTTENLAAANQAEADLRASKWVPAGTGAQASENADRLIVDQTMRPLQRKYADSLAGIDPEGTVMRDTGGLQRAVDDIRLENGPGVPDSASQVPDDWLAALDKVVGNGDDGAPQQLSVQSLQNIRVKLGRAIKEARREGKDGRRIALKRLKDAIDQDMIDLARGGDEAGLRARQHLEGYRTEFAPLFDQEAGGELRKAVGRDDLARSKTPRTETLGRFIRPSEMGGSRETAAALRRILDASPDPAGGNAEVRRYLVDSLSRAIGADGRTNLVQARTWAEHHANILEQFPAFRDEVRGFLRDAINSRARTQGLEAELKAARASQKLTEKEIGDSALSIMLDHSPANAAKAVFSGNDPERAMREITASVSRDPAAKVAWKKAVSEYLERALTGTNTESTADGARPVSLAKVTNMLDEHAKVLTQVYSPEEMSKLRQAQAQIRVLSRMRLTGGGPGTTTAEDIANLLRGGEIGLTAGTGAFKAGRFMRTLKLAMEVVPGLNIEAKANQLLTRAAFDPELAALLLETPTSRPATVAWGHKIAVLLGTGEAARTDTRKDK